MDQIAEQASNGLGRSEAASVDGRAISEAIPETLSGASDLKGVSIYDSLRFKSGNEPISMIVANKRAIFREGLARILNDVSRFRVVRTCRDGIEAVEQTRQLKPDMLLVDEQISGYNCVETTRRIKALQCQTRVVILTCSLDGENVLPCLEAGATGYIGKDVEIPDLVDNIVRIHSGELVISAPMAERLVRELVIFQRHRAAAHTINVHISHREREVLQLVAKGANNKQVGEALFISEHTVKVHLSKIFEKLQAHSRQQAVAKAMEIGMIEVQVTSSPWQHTTAERVT